jgi:hypothetical protein
MSLRSGVAYACGRGKGGCITSTCPPDMPVREAREDWCRQRYAGLLRYVLTGWRRGYDGSEITWLELSAHFTALKTVRVPEVLAGSVALALEGMTGDSVMGIQLLHQRINW